MRVIWTLCLLITAINNNRVHCHQSLLQSPIVKLLMQSLAPNYIPKHPGDLFDILRDRYPLPNGLQSPLSEYDYIIVGAGSAGCVLASRLTEDPDVSVLVLEAGKPENQLTDIPSMAPYFQYSEYAWPYMMEPQPDVCLGMINQQSYWPRGKSVGGSSVINYMVYTRGRPEEWDGIAADGNNGWSYKEVLHYYKKSERANLKGYEDSPYRGKDGEMNIEFVNYRTPLVEAFLEAGRTLGSPTIDYNSPEQLGFGYLQTNTRAGRRMSAAKAFLHLNKERPNLHILTLATVTKILIDSNTKTAYGVEYVRNRLKNTVTARREVILSAGPIASPQLLMLSGIGPEEKLKKHGISVIQGLPVGQTLYDHILYPGLVFTLNATYTESKKNKDSMVKKILSWMQFGNTSIASPGMEAIGFIKISNSSDPIPDIELISLSESIASDGSKPLRRGMYIDSAVYKYAFGTVDNKKAYTILPTLLHPRSFGHLELRDSNPFSHPKVHGNYYTHTIDTATMIAAIRYIQNMMNLPPFQRFGAKLHKAQFPACPKLTYDSDEYWECAIRTLTATLYHPIATCRMGPVGDPLAVVDPELRVHGINRLRVVDSSILPHTISGHTHGPAVMIGEKGADMIKAFWKSCSQNLTDVAVQN